eukprot:GHVT01020507.1.p1 GENE.GHVT01020507.1~~GHVT01020507.1.p1  ORF type:complete len:115 (-),score=21.65 GHVT01020507.1:18-362(-)
MGGSSSRGKTSGINKSTLKKGDEYDADASSIASPWPLLTDGGSPSDFSPPGRRMRGEKETAEDAWRSLGLPLWTTRATGTHCRGQRLTVAEGTAAAAVERPKQKKQWIEKRQQI